MLEVAEKEKYEKSATGKNITYIYFEILVLHNILFVGGRHTVCHGSFTSRLGD